MGFLGLSSELRLRHSCVGTLEHMLWEWLHLSKDTLICTSMSQATHHACAPAYSAGSAVITCELPTLCISTQNRIQMMTEEYMEKAKQQKRMMKAKQVSFHC
jgi:hypothetical protein